MAVDLGRAVPGPFTMTAVGYGAVEDASDPHAIEAVQTHLHDDILADLLGCSRRGGVRWYHYPPSDPTAGHVATMMGTRAEAESGELLAFLASHPGGLLIVAMCDYDP